jgi:glutamate carboxypeptidase
MQTYLPYLDSLKSQQRPMLDLLTSWVNINSGSNNLEGLNKMLDAIEATFGVLNGKSERIPLAPRQQMDSKGKTIEMPSAPALSIKKPSTAPFKVLLAGHIDTVFPLSSPFQRAEQLDPDILRGPGSADMKGGLVIMLKALEAFEKSPFADKLSWEVLINPDEELGSPSSEPLFAERAPHYNIGLIFEPSFPDGSLVNERKGSINYTIVAHGKAAHAGRDYHAGRNAITALAHFVKEVENLNDRNRGITVNVGSFEGGGPTNIVPDLAVCKVNIRMQNPQDLPHIQTAVRQIINRCPEGVSFELHEHTIRPPKPYNKPHHQLFEALKTCAKDLGLDLKWQPSGGVCDGNTLWAAGLPTIDTLGAVGGHLHTHDEFIFIPSLVERAQLTACFLMQLAEKVHTLEKTDD